MSYVVWVLDGRIAPSTESTALFATSGDTGEFVPTIQH